MSTARLNLFWIVVFGLTLPVGVVLSTHLARRSFEKVKLRDQVISVKGYAERSITADYATWSASVTARHNELAPAYEQLERGRAALLAYLAKTGFPPDQVHLSPVDIEIRYVQTEEGEDTNAIEGHVLRQHFTIASRDVARVAHVAREVSDLIKAGIELESSSPAYLYTKLDDLKLDMLGEATGNARQRAEQLVSHSSSALGALRSASQGVFQITPAHSTEVSDYGVNDTSSIDKLIKAVVTVEYAIQ